LPKYCEHFGVHYESDQILIQGRQKEPLYRNLAKKLKQESDQKVDTLLHQAHDEVFESFDCLTCANCCKTTSPVFLEKDVERIASSLRMKPGNFIMKYLKRDEEGDLVLKSSPCAFLLPDNSCSIYENRPAACKKYPHTDRKKVKQLLNLTLKNSLICPAVQEILLRVNESINIRKP